MNKRQFNTIGTCIPASDYMVDISGRVQKVKEMVDRGNYFTINRPRQYGKTTLISALSRRLSGEYICARISFEGLGDESFENAKAFSAAFMDKIQNALKNSNGGYETDYANNWNNPGVTSFNLLNKHITEMCRTRKVVLLIDEVDKISNNRVFLHFLGVLRDKFLQRKEGLDCTFQSVILAGVHDIRNLKLKLENEGGYKHTGHMLNSPWNIATPFFVDMSFYPGEIALMLEEYGKDNAIDMDSAQIAGAIYEYTEGYPFLVSKICQMLDESDTLSHDWSAAGVKNAAKLLIDQMDMDPGVDTLFDDISKNLENNTDIYNFIYDVLILGKQFRRTLSDPVIQRAAMFGIIKNKDGMAAISNRLFEIYIADYFISKDSRNQSNNRILGYKGDLVESGRFDMERCLIKFAKLFRELYTDKDRPFIEVHGRMLFLTYLKPLINGAGFCHIESQLTDQRRMDLVVDYGLDQFIIELKLWYGESAHDKAFDQLAGYLTTKGMPTGYLLTYDFRKDQNREPKEKWVEWGGLRIFDVVL